MSTISNNVNGSNNYYNKVKTLNSINETDSAPLPEFLDASVFQIGLNRERKGLSEFTPVLIQAICNLAYVTLNSENSRFMLALHKFHQSNLTINSFKQEIAHFKEVFGLKTIVQKEALFDINLPYQIYVDLLKGIEKLEKDQPDEAFLKAYIEVQPRFEAALREIDKLFWGALNSVSHFTNVNPAEAKIILDNYELESKKPILDYFREVEKHIVDLNDTMASCQTELDRLADLTQGRETIKPLVSTAQGSLKHIDALMKEPTPEVMEGCQILLTHLHPDKVTLDKLTFTSNRAYIVSHDTLFYANKKAKHLEKIRLSDNDDVKKAQLKLFKGMIRLPKHVGDVFRDLNKKELSEIPIATGHIPSDFFKRFMKIANDKMRSCETSLNNLLNEISLSDLHDEIQPLKVVLENLKTHVEQTSSFADSHHIEPRKSIVVESNHVKNYSVSEAKIGGSHHVKNNDSYFDTQIINNENESELEGDS